MKKFFLSLLAMILPLLANASNPTSVVVNGLTYYLDYPHIGEAQVTITQTPGLMFSDYTGDVTIASSISHGGNNYTVTTIGDNTFYRSTITSVSIPNTITTIRPGAFMDCGQLTEITLPSSVTTIGNFAFEGSAITSINIPSSVQSIGLEAFQYCYSLESITIPSTVNTIGEYAFRGCTHLTSLTIDAGTTSIANHAFEDCASLFSIQSNSETPVAFGQDAFKNISSKCVLTVPTGKYYTYNTAGWTTEVFKGGIDDDYFYMTAESYSITYGETIPEFTYSFASAPFTGSPTFTCQTTDTYPNAGMYWIHVSKGTITHSRHHEQFTAGYLSVNKATLSVTPKDYVISKNDPLPDFEAVYNGFKNGETVSVLTKLPTLSCSTASTSVPGVYEITASGATAQNYSFNYAKGTLTILETEAIEFADDNVKALCVSNWDTNHDGDLSITEAAAVTSLGTVFRVKQNITSFNELQYFTGLTSIGNEAFFNCQNLTSVIIPNNVTNIGNQAFRNCTNLTSITLPNTVTTIGNYAFLGVPVTIYNDHLFGYLEYNHAGAYSIPDGIETIADYAFAGRTNLTEISIPNSVTSIGQYAFNNCSGLTSITIPNGVTSIGQYAFGQCTGLTSITIPNSVTSIGARAFYACTNLESISSLGNITAINYETFRDCSALTSITLPSSVESIASTAFLTCTSLATVNSKIETPFTLNSYAFDGISNNCVLSVPKGKINAYIAAGWTTDVFKGGIIDGAHVSADNITIKYGSAIPIFTYSVTDGTIEGEPSFSCSATATSPIGTYPIVISTGTVTTEGVTYHNGTLTIEKAPLTITANSFTKEYGDEVPTYTINYQGFKNSETSSVLTTQPTLNCSATATSIPGTYDIVVSGAEAANYELSFVNGTLTVEKAPLTITARSYTINQLDALPTYQVDYTGFKNSETSSVLTTLPTITCTATDSKTAGEYIITPSDAEAQNYDINYVNGTLTINAVENVTITIGSLGQGTYCSQYDLDFSGVSGIKAYVACGFKPSTGTVFIMHVDEVPANTGIMVKGTPGTYTIPVKETDMYYKNMFKGTLVSMTVPATEDGCQNYVLRNGDYGVAFYVSHGSSTLGAHKAYLQTPLPAAGAPEFVELVEDHVTGIVGIDGDNREDNGEFYNLNGQRVTTPKRGLFIRNGKKIIIR